MKLVGMMLLLLLSFPAVGGRIIMALFYISVRMEKKKQQQQWRVGLKEAVREQQREGKVRGTDDFRGRFSKRVVNDEVERHDFK